MRRLRSVARLDGTAERGGSIESIALGGLIAAVGLAVVHVFAGKLRFLDVIPRSRWLSFAGGASVAYVFLHLLPALERSREELQRVGDPVGAADRHIYIIALIGLAVFYGLERVAERSREEERVREGLDRTTRRVFWLHIGSFALFNVLVGYLLIRGERAELTQLGLYATAMGLHFVVNDYGLRQHHKELYRAYGRWLVAAAVLAGWALGLVARIPDAAVATLTAFVGGGVILNVLKEELPADRESRFWPLAVGMAGYGALLLAL